jgi:hypothetical protein
MVNKFNPEIIEAMKKDELVFFVGAGFSTGFGLPSWVGLVKNILDKLTQYNSKYATYIPLLNDDDVDLLTILDFVKKGGQEARVRGFLETSFHLDNINTLDLKKHKKLLDVSKKIVTTNYDCLLEEAAGRDVQKVVYTNKYKIANLPSYDKFIYKVHGDYEEPDKCVFFRDDYIKFYGQDNAPLNELKKLISSKCIVFIGFSLSDPYVRDLFDFIHQLYGGLRKPHFMLTTSNDNFTQYGVEVLKLNSYDELEQYLDDLIAIKTESEDSSKKKTKIDDSRKTEDSVTRDIGIIQDIFEFILKNQGEHGYKDDGKTVGIREKIEINFDEDEREMIAELAIESMLKFQLINNILEEFPNYQQSDIHGDIKRRYIMKRLEGLKTSKILFELINHYTPDGKEDNPEYTAIAQALVFFFFEDCTWGKKTEKELLV